MRSLNFIIIALCIFSTHSLRAAGDQKEFTKLSDLKPLEKSQMEAELESMIGSEDKWKVSAGSLLHNYLFGKSGLYTSYRDKAYEAPSSRSENKKAILKADQKLQKEISEAIQKEGSALNAVLTLIENKTLDTTGIKTLVSLYKRLFSNTKSPLNNLTTVLQSEKRMIVEGAIREVLSVQPTHLEKANDIKNGRYISHEKRALIKAMMLARDFNNGLVQDKKQVQEIVRLISNFSRNFSIRAKFAQEHSLPLFIELERAALNSEISPIIFELSKAIRAASSLQVQTPNYGELLVLATEDIAFVDELIKRTTEELSSDMLRLSDIAFEKVPAGRLGNNYLTTLRDDKVSKAAREQITDFWNNGGNIQEILSQLDFTPRVMANSCQRLFSL